MTWTLTADTDELNGAVWKPGKLLITPVANVDGVVSPVQITGPGGVLYDPFEHGYTQDDTGKFSVTLPSQDVGVQPSEFGFKIRVGTSGPYIDVPAQTAGTTHELRDFIATPTSIPMLPGDEVRLTAVENLAATTAADVAALQDEEDGTAADLAAHIADGTGAHAASAISNTPAGGISATTVQDALNELDTEKASTGALASEASSRAAGDTALGAALTAVTLSGVTATITTDTALTPGMLNPVDASGGARAVTLAAAAQAGQQVAIAKSDSSTNQVTLTLNLRGTTGTLTLKTQQQGYLLEGKADGSWWVVGDHRTETALDARYKRKQVEGSGLIRAMVDASPMYTPPTLSAQTAQFSGYTTQLAATWAGFRYSGTDMINISGAYYPRNNHKTDGSVSTWGGAWAVEFDLESTALVFKSQVPSTAYFKLFVNERPHAAAPQQMNTVSGVSGAGSNYFKADFGTRGYRRIRIEFATTTASPAAWGGVYKAATDSVLPPAISSPTVAFIGDSYGAGVGADWNGDSWTNKAAKQLGFAHSYSVGCVPSTGLIKTNSGALAGNYADRVQTDVIAYAPDIVVIQGSINDLPYIGLNQIGPALVSLVATLKVALPNATIIVTSPLYAGTPLTGHTTIRDELQAAATTLGLPFVSAMDTTIGYFTGTGYVGGVQGDGNADYYAANVTGIHPSSDGALAFAKVLSAQISVILGQSSGGSQPLDLSTLGAALPSVVRTYLADATWTKPAGLTGVYATAIGPGGAGGSGRRGATSTARFGGGGGAGGIIAQGYIPAGLLASSEAVLVGVATAGGAARTTDDTDGAAGGAATKSSFGNVARGGIFAVGGASGSAGTATAGTGAGNLIGTTSGGASSTTATAANGGTPGGLISAPGGGGGGGIDASNVARNGGNGGGSPSLTGSTGGVAPGGTPTGAATGAALPGAGGPGGNANATGAAGNGTNGAQYGAGGGGGSASLNGNNSGKGGDGGPGIVIVVEFY